MKKLITRTVSFSKIFNYDSEIGGWGNGYVGVPTGHPFYKIHYNELPFIPVHGGLTTSGNSNDYEHLKMPKDYWVFGFDTGHCFSNPKDHNRDFVKKETKLLKKILEDNSKELLSKTLKMREIRKEIEKLEEEYSSLES